MHKGFTLVETLVAITVLLLVVIGPMTVAQRGIQNAFYATEQTTAVFLAQEAIEAVRALRDEAALEAFHDGGNPWVWAPATCNTQAECAYLGSGLFQQCGSGNNGCRLYVTEAGEYTHDVSLATGESPFTRSVYIALNGDTAEVRVTVSWQNRIFSNDAEREVILSTWIYDHYQRYEN
jgi:prepilin-type N-terminal cleavage/methylation domain-containing protein